MTSKAIKNLDHEESPPSRGCSSEQKYGELAGAENAPWGKKRRWLSQATTVITPNISHRDHMQ